MICPDSLLRALTVFDIKDLMKHLRKFKPNFRRCFLPNAMYLSDCSENMKYSPWTDTGMFGAFVVCNQYFSNDFPGSKNTATSRTQPATVLDSFEQDIEIVSSDSVAFFFAFRAAD